MSQAVEVAVLVMVGVWLYVCWLVKKFYTEKGLGGGVNQWVVVGLVELTRSRGRKNPIEVEWVTVSCVPENCTRCILNTL